MGHAGYRSKSDKRKRTRTPHEKARRSRASKMRLRRKELGIVSTTVDKPFTVQLRKGVYETRNTRLQILQWRPVDEEA